MAFMARFHSWKTYLSSPLNSTGSAELPSWQHHIKIWMAFKKWLDCSLLHVLCRIWGLMPSRTPASCLARKKNHPDSLLEKNLFAYYFFLMPGLPTFTGPALVPLTVACHAEMTPVKLVLAWQEEEKLNYFHDRLLNKSGNKASFKNKQTNPACYPTYVCSPFLCTV